MKDENTKLSRRNFLAAIGAGGAAGLQATSSSEADVTAPSTNLRIMTFLLDENTLPLRSNYSRARSGAREPSGPEGEYSGPTPGRLPSRVAPV